jgi:uncharacterized protein
LKKERGMVIEVSKVPAKGCSIERSFSPEELSLSGDKEFSLTEPAEAKLEIKVKEGKCEIRGQVSFELELSCSRCLEPFLFGSRSSFEVFYLPRREIPNEPDIGLTAEDLKISFYEEDELDLSGVIREQIILTLPMKPVCSPDCKGLCPICGVNLNRGSCNCQRDSVDPRLEPLKKLRARLKSKG